MRERDCKTCVYASPFGGENDNRCSAWDCEYINKQDAIKAYKTLMNNANGKASDNKSTRNAIA